jgi:hypothetical protein
MRKWIIASLAAAAVVGAGAFAPAYAAPGDAPAGPGMMEHHGPSPEIMGAILDAKLAGMKAALKLTADQEKTWGAFESAVRAAVKEHGDAMREMRERGEKGEHLSPIDRVNEIADHLARASTELKQVADAAKPLYDSLGDQQKREFGPLLRFLHEGMGPHGDPGMMMMHGGEGGEPH